MQSASMSVVESFLKGKGVEVLPGLACRLLNKTNLKQINELIASHYTYEYPTRRIFKIKEEDIGNFDVRATIENLKSNASIGTFVKTTGELVAVEMHTIHDITEGDKFKQHPATSERNAAELRLVQNLLGDVFADLNTRRFMRGRMGCLKSEYQATGLLRSLEELRIGVARERGCEYLVTVINSMYGIRAAKREGYSVLREVSFRDYVDPKTGEKPVLELSPIHTVSQAVYKKVPT